MLWVLGTGKAYTEMRIIGFPMALLLVTIPRIGVREPEPINTLQNVHDVRVPSNDGSEAALLRDEVSTVTIINRTYIPVHESPALHRLVVCVVSTTIKRKRGELT